jgi:hypothetical protein
VHVQRWLLTKLKIFFAMYLSIPMNVGRNNYKYENKLKNKAYSCLALCNHTHFKCFFFTENTPFRLTYFSNRRRPVAILSVSLEIVDKLREIYNKFISRIHQDFSASSDSIDSLLTVYNHEISRSYLLLTTTEWCLISTA